MQIGYLNAFTDNYIWFIQNNHDLVVIDPGESAVVIDYITTNQLNLKSLILTHDHNDNIGGVAEILKKYKVPVFGMGEIPDRKLSGGEVVDLTNWLTAKTLATPGHTYTSICYMMELNGHKHLFCGDTLFAAGCGRVFTGDFKAMYKSLTELGSLDPEFQVYPGHEYTLKNLSFAQYLEPDNTMVTNRIKIEQEKLERTGNSLPVSMAVELLTNPFLRTSDPDIVNAVSQITGKNLNPGFECFVQLRELRNNF